MAGNRESRRGPHLCCFQSKIPRYNRKCEKAPCHDATASSLDAKVRGEASPNFHAVIINAIVVCGIDSLACNGKLFIKNAVDGKENDVHGIGFALHLFCLFQSW